MKILANTLDKNTIKSQKNKKKFFVNRKSGIITCICAILCVGLITLFKPTSKPEIKTNRGVREHRLANQNRKSKKYETESKRVKTLEEKITGFYQKNAPCTHGTNQFIKPQENTRTSSTHEKKGQNYDQLTKTINNKNIIKIPQTPATPIKTNEKLQQNIDSIKNNLTKINVILHSEECIVHNGNEHIESHEFNDEFLQDILDKEIIIIMFNSEENYNKIVSYCKSVENKLKQVSIDDKIIANMLDQTNELHTRLNQLYDNTIGINGFFNELKKKKESGIISSVFNWFTSTNEAQNIEYIQNELTNLLCETGFTASVKEKKCLIYLENNLTLFIS